MTENQDPTASQTTPYHSLNNERTQDLGGCPWDEYLLYVLEVDVEDVNEDGLQEIASVFESLNETGGRNEPTDDEDCIELTERQRRRLAEIKQECTEGGRVPEPSDQTMFSSLLDTWDAVNEGLYSETNDQTNTSPSND